MNTADTLVFRSSDSLLVRVSITPNQVSTKLGKRRLTPFCSGMGSSLHIAQIETADALGISRKSLWEKIRKHKVKR